jgi:hypothetical protein
MLKNIFIWFVFIRVVSSNYLGMYSGVTLDHADMFDIME